MRSEEQGLLFWFCAFWFCNVFTNSDPYSPFHAPKNYVMIKVTKLDGTEYYVNPHQIECIEINPDTTLIMLSGKYFIVKEEADEILLRIETYRKRITPYVVQE